MTAPIRGAPRARRGRAVMHDSGRGAGRPTRTVLHTPEGRGQSYYARGSSCPHYADLRIMPTCARKGAWEAVIAAMRSA